MQTVLNADKVIITYLNIPIIPEIMVYIFLKFINCPHWQPNRAAFPFIANLSYEANIGRYLVYLAFYTILNHDLLYYAAKH